MKKIKFLKLKMCCNILFSKKQHFFIVSLDSENLTKIVREQDNIKCQLSLNGLNTYLYYKIIHFIENSQKDDINLILEKAQFDADFFEGENLN